MKAIEIFGRATREMAMPIVIGREGPKWKLYTKASLRQDFVYRGRTFRKGSVGQIVDIHGNHEAYEVEFQTPFAVITLRANDLVPRQ